MEGAAAGAIAGATKRRLDGAGPPCGKELERLQPKTRFWYDERERAPRAQLKRTLKASVRVPAPARPQSPVGNTASYARCFSRRYRHTSGDTRNE